MADTLHVLDIQGVRKHFQIPDHEGLSDDFFLMKTEVDKNLLLFKYPCRFDGFVAVLCLRGRLRVDLNLKSFELCENTLLLYVPGNIVRVSEVADTDEPPQVVVVGASSNLISDVRMDFAKLFEESMAMLENPCITLTQKEFGISMKYYELAVELIDAGMPGLREAIRSLFSSVFYMLGTLWTGRLNSEPVAREGVSGRSKLVFEQFLRLVTQYHNKERRVEFYAAKMYLTPKYLSKLIKKVSGRSAPDWIESMVVMEAKNMLKYSEMTIKEISDNLGFGSVPVFHKFFKYHTGFTPKQWRENG